MTSKGLEVLGEFDFLTSYWLLAVHHKENKVRLVNSSDSLLEDFFL